ncbi:MAG: DEAD/DEAH box helicase [Phycisphaerales bacterium]|nr:DEAD/DEAH box helicase [Phycisphaerales bacterium]
MSWLATCHDGREVLLSPNVGRRADCRIDWGTMHRHPELPKAFEELGIEVPILRALTAIGYETPSPVQRELVPLALAGKDLLGQARTGTGKTAAFGMPVLQMIDPQARLQALVLTPTRELAVQVLGELRRLAKYLDIHCVPVYGGTRIKRQVHQLGRKPHLIVGTPGRVLDMLQRKVLSFDKIRFAVLDEVDRMLDIGFRDDIKRILGRISHPHQTIFVSATFDEEIKRLSKQFMKDPVEINVSRDQLTVSEVTQQYCVVEPWDKFRLLKLLLKQEQPRQAIVFCRTKQGARKLARRLHAAGFNAREIHGDLVQQKRERIMERFRKHHIPILVATDLASRGIDVQGISHIINFDMPEDIEVYVHRIGRTARMGAAGKAVSFVTTEQGKGLTEVEMLINQELEKIVVDGFKPSPPPKEREPAPEPSEAPAPAPAPATKAVSQDDSAAPAARTLGGKFPVSRRRRRL